MHGDWERHRKELVVLRESLKQDPTNLELANRYWNAVGNGQSGGDVRDAYRDAALASTVGAAAFAKAYRELSLCSGEGPRMGHFDEALIQALKTYLPQLTGEDHSNVEWVLQEIGLIPQELPSYARIHIKSGGLTEACFEWLDFDGDDCFMDFHINITSETGSHRFDFGPCVVSGLRKLSRFFKDPSQTSVSGGFRHPDERYYEVHRTADGYRVVVRFDGSDLNEQFSIPCRYLQFDNKILNLYSQ